MSCDFRIIDFNYAFDSASSISASSSDSNFPVSNISKYFRSKVWRSSLENGTFVITSSNKYINFKDGGSELTATLTPGTYTATTLAAHIKLKMEDQTADTITVSYSSVTGKWTISTSGTTLELLFSTGTNAANSARDVIGFGSSDFTGADSYVSPKICIHTEESIVIDTSTTEEIDSFVMLFDAQDGNKLTQSAVVKLQANATLNWTSPAVDVTLSFDELYNSYSHFFSSNQSYRYWRVKIVDSQNPNLQVEIGKIILGKGTVVQGPENGIVMKSNDLSKVVVTPYGHKYADIYPQQRSVEMAFSVMDLSDVETLYSIYQRCGNFIPITICLDTQAEIFDKDKFLIYGYFEGDFVETQKINRYFDVKIKLVEAM
jgi:hypothetical protein